MPVGGPHRENWPALQAVRAASSVGGTCGDGVIPTVGVFAAAALRAAVPTGGRRSLACRAISPSGVRAETGAIRRLGYSAAAALRAAVPGPTGRTARRSAFQAVLALVLRLRCAALTLAGWSVIGTGFALPRDAGRRPALQSSPRLFSVCGTRHPPWRDGASSARVSRSRAMPVGDRRSWRFPACSAKRRPADLAAGLLGGTFAESRTPVGERTALPADRRRWKSPAAESRSRWSRWSRCSCRSSRG